MNPNTIKLIGQALDQTIEPQEFEELQKILKTDPEAFENYCLQAEMHGRLMSELKAKIADVGKPKVIPFYRKSVAKVAAIAAVLVLSGVSIYRVVSDDAPRSVTPIAQDKPEEDKVRDVADKTNFVARITNAEKAVWGSPDIGVGSWLRPGSLKLLSGKAEITYDSGARVVLSGPAEINSLSAHLAKLTTGKAVVHIPNQAAGFSLETPTSTFSDQACSFALSVENDSTDIHVFKGSVEAASSSDLAAVKMLAVNEAFSFTDKSQLLIEATKFDSDNFRQELVVNSDTEKFDYFKWSFDSLADNAFPESGSKPFTGNSAIIKQLKRMPGEASAQSIPGPFGRAIRFEGKGSYLSTPAPDIIGASERTVAFWVRVPKNVTKKESYAFYAWGEPRSRSGTKWQIAWNTRNDNTGTLGAIRTEFGGGYVVGSTDLRDGKWHHITSVYLGQGDGEADVTNQVRHYVDGKLEHVSASKHRSIYTKVNEASGQLAYIGRRLEDDNFFHSLRADMDEIYLFPAALTPAQIETLYLANKVPQNLIHSFAKHSE